MLHARRQLRLETYHRRRSRREDRKWKKVMRPCSDVYLATITGFPMANADGEALAQTLRQAIFVIVPIRFDAVVKWVGVEVRETRGGEVNRVG